jgi:hypothetical protein
VVGSRLSFAGHVIGVLSNFCETNISLIRKKDVEFWPLITSKQILDK